MRKHTFEIAKFIKCILILFFSSDKKMVATKIYGIEMDLVDSLGKGQHLESVFFDLVKNAISQVGVKFVRIVTLGGRRGKI